MKAKLLNTGILIAFLGFGCMFLLTSCSSAIKSPNASTNEKDALYDRVMATGKIKCGYFLFPPYCMKNSETGKLSGIFVDSIEEAAKNLSLKCEWTEEVGYGTMIEGLRTGRYDLVPTGVWPNSNRARYADFSIPLFYSGVGVYARSDDDRFTKNLSAINDKAVTISTIDGTIQVLMAKNLYPAAKILSHPEMSEASQILLDVTSKKADVTLIEPGLVALFLKKNPGTVKNVSPKKPIGVVGNTMMFKLGEPSFKSMLNNALSELINTGFIERKLDEYEPARGAYFRIARPYE